ncbi:MAG: ATP-binding protein, partial [Myxococcota bacterium]
FDANRGLMRLSVRDDGRGMNEDEVEGYLIIGFSDKDPRSQRGRFGVGKLSPYALGISRMVVETCDGRSTHRITFNRDGSGTMARLAARPRGTVVRVYKRCSRHEAEGLAERTFRLVQQTCGSIAIPLFVNGTQVNRETALPTVYALNFASGPGQGVLGIVSEPVHCLMGGGIVLETEAPILGQEVSYILDSPRLAPTLSRNAVRRDQAFDELLRGARAKMPAFRAHVARQLRVRSDRLRQDGTPPERGLDANDRAALEWLRSQLLLPEDDPPDAVVRDAPVLETADGGLVSANELIEVIRKEGRVPISRVPRTREEIGGYADRGVPVLLLYRDLEDFLERQSIETVEVDGLDDGIEVAEVEWGRGEAALASRIPLAVTPSWRRPNFALVLTTVMLLAVIAAPMWLYGWFEMQRSVPMARIEAIDPPPSTDRVLAPEPPVPAVVLDDMPPETQSPPQAADLVPVVVRSRWSVILAGIIAVLWAAAGLGMIFSSRRRPRRSWLRTEAGAPLTLGENRKRRWNVVSRALLHPVDFLVARGWSIRAAGRPLASSASASIKGYREFAPEVPIRSGVRLDLDRVELGFVDLVSRAGDPNDGRFLLRRQGRILLNRNHPTVIDLITIAEAEPQRARVLLDMLLATDADLGRGTDPRQVEWDLLGRAEIGLRPEKS